MLERVYDTLKGIIFTELPKNTDGKAIVYDRPITNWYFGDRNVIPSAMSIVLYGSTDTGKDVAFGVREYEHRIQIACWAGADNQETSERVVQEMSRLVQEALLPHRRIWVIELCPICGKFALSPQHFTIAHGSVIAPYVTISNTAFSAIWAQTHTGSAPTPDASAQAADAFIRMYLDIQGGATPGGLTEMQLAAFTTDFNDKVRPIRLLYDCVLQDIKPSNDGNNEQLLKNGNFVLVAKELVIQPAYGPDNVPTNAE